MYFLLKSMHHLQVILQVTHVEWFLEMVLHQVGGQKLSMQGMLQRVGRP